MFYWPRGQCWCWWQNFPLRICSNRQLDQNKQIQYLFEVGALCQVHRYQDWPQFNPAVHNLIDKLLSHSELLAIINREASLPQSQDSSFYSQFTSVTYLEEISVCAQWIFIEKLKSSLNKLIFLQIWFVIHHKYVLQIR